MSSELTSPFVKETKTPAVIGCVCTCKSCRRVFWTLWPTNICDGCKEKLLYDASQEDVDG